MATVTVDQRGLAIDGKRRWIVSGTIDPAQTPAELWPHRLRAATEAGLNTILVPAAWSVHEPRPGAFDFSGDRDLPAFIRLAHNTGLLVILRPGPFQGAGWDRGGIPPWVTAGTTESGETLALRSSAPEFLQACATWFKALGDQLKDLQATKGGPIVLVQSEHRWFCSDPAQADTYLTELARYLRESGFQLPRLNTNNLYASAEGEIDAWNGYDSLTPTLRQLRAVRPDHTPFVCDFELARPSVWNSNDKPKPPAQALHNLAQAVSAGAQLNLGPFAGGSRFAFTGGRLPFSRNAYVTQSADGGAPLDQAGRPTDLLDTIKPLLLFQSSFERTLINANWSAVGAISAPDSGSDTIVHASGDAGSVIFLLRDPDSKAKHLERRVLLPDGKTITVDLKDAPAVWCAMDVSLGPASKLDYTNASAIWAAHRALALTAPAGSKVVVSINGSELELTPTKGRTPASAQHEGVTVLALSTEQTKSAILDDDALLIGASTSNTPRDGWKKWFKLNADGNLKQGAWEIKSSKPNRRTLTDWTTAPTTAFTTGSSERFAYIESPATLEELGADTGYGWMRLRFRTTAAKKTKALAPESGDRIHIYLNGALQEIAGLAPGASEAPFNLPITKGDNTVTALIDNLGRPSGGWSELQRKGLWGPIYEVKPFRAGPASLITGKPLRPLDFRSPLTRLHYDDETHTSRVTWTFTHRKKTPILFRAGTIATGVSGLLVINDEIVEALDEGSRGDILLRNGTLRAGTNTVQFAPLSDPAAALSSLRASAAFFECINELTAKPEWAFARWELPQDRDFNEQPEPSHPGTPAWFRATFPAQPATRPLAFDPKGLTKGQLFLNGHNVGRYFVTTHDGKKVTGQSAIYLPEPWINSDAPNTITIFDEHGADPSACRITLFK